MTDQAVLAEVDGTVARITINRPDHRNALNFDVIAGMSRALAEWESHTDIRAVVLTGAGDKAFCAGADLGGMSSDGKIAQHFERAQLGDLFRQMRTSRFPILARVNGHALAGGFGLLLACDIVVAAEDAEMGTPEIDVGLWPFIITAIIQRDLPRKVALEMMLTGRRMTMGEGRHLGIVGRAVPRDELDAEVATVVDGLVSKSPLTLALGKRSFYRAEDMAFDHSLDYLAGMLSVCLESEDTAEGIAAFLEKRAPNFKGR